MDRYDDLLGWLAQAPVSALVRSHAEVLVLILNRLLRCPELARKIEQLSVIDEILQAVAPLQSMIDKDVGRRLREIANAPRMKQLLHSHLRKVLEMKPNSEFWLVAILNADQPADTISQEGDQGQTLIHYACAQQNWVCYERLYRYPGVKKELLDLMDLSASKLDWARNLIDQIG